MWCYERLVRSSRDVLTVQTSASDLTATDVGSAEGDEALWEETVLLFRWQPGRERFRAGAQPL